MHRKLLRDPGVDGVLLFPKENSSEGSQPAPEFPNSAIPRQGKPPCPPLCPGAAQLSQSPCPGRAAPEHIAGALHLAFMYSREWDKWPNPPFVQVITILLNVGFELPPYGCQLLLQVTITESYGGIFSKSIFQLELYYELYDNKWLRWDEAEITRLSKARNTSFSLTCSRNLKAWEWIREKIKEKANRSPGIFAVALAEAAPVLWFVPFVFMCTHCAVTHSPRGQTPLPALLVKSEGLRRGQIFISSIPSHFFIIKFFMIYFLYHKIFFIIFFYHKILGYPGWGGTHSDHWPSSWPCTHPQSPVPDCLLQAMIKTLHGI